MKTSFARQESAGLTRVEVMVVIVVLMILAVLLFLVWNSPYPERRNYRQAAQRIACINNLKQSGIAFRLWEGDHAGKYPMQVSVTNGGAMELIATGNVAACFQVMSNEVNTPKILLCPADTRRVWATNFSALNNSNVSYFVGLDVTNDTNPQMFLSGDDHFAIGGIPVKPGLLELLTNTPVAWTKARHKFVGIIGLADSSVEQSYNQIETHSLTNLIQQTGVATNRLALP